MVEKGRGGAGGGEKKNKEKRRKNNVQHPLGGNAENKQASIAFQHERHHLLCAPKPFREEV